MATKAKRGGGTGWEGQGGGSFVVKRRKKGYERPRSAAKAGGSFKTWKMKRTGVVKLEAFRGGKMACARPAIVARPGVLLKIRKTKKTVDMKTKASLVGGGRNTSVLHYPAAESKCRTSIVMKSKTTSFERRPEFRSKAAPLIVGVTSSREPTPVETTAISTVVAERKRTAEAIALRDAFVRAGPGAGEGRGRDLDWVIAKVAFDRDARDGATMGHKMGSYRDAAHARLTEGLQKSTKGKYASIKRTFQVYLLLEGIGDEERSELLNEGMHSDDSGRRRLSAEKLMMGFAEWLVTLRGVSVDTAQDYVRTIKRLAGEKSGMPLDFGINWTLLPRLYTQLRNAFPKKAKRRDGVNQVDLRECLKLIKSIPEQPARSTRVGSKKSVVDGATRIVQKLGKNTCSAMLVVFFLGVARGSDWLPATQSSFRASRHATRNDIKFLGTDKGRMNIKVKYTKVGANVKFASKPFVRLSGNPLCAVTAIEQMLDNLKGALSDEDQAQAPLFTDVKGKPITTANLYDLVKALVKAIGRNPDFYGAHSLRIGGATAALMCCNGNEEIVRVMGYWSSSAMRLYMRPTASMLREVQTSMATSVSVPLVAEDEDDEN